MRLGFGVALLLVAALPVSALADNLASVSITGDPSSSSFSSNFTLDLNNYTVSTDSSGLTTYVFMDPAAMVGGMTDPLTITLYNSFDGNGLNLMDGSGLNESLDIAANGSDPILGGGMPFFQTDPSVAVNAGTYSGFDYTACVAESRMPGEGSAATLAMLQAPLCGAVTLVATTVTPEPSSVALFATGLLGVGGVMRRRFFAA